MPTMDEFVLDRLDNAGSMTAPPATPDIEDGTLNLGLVKMMYDTLKSDRAEIFDKAYQYLHGDHLRPHSPLQNDTELEDLRARSISNWMPLLVNLPQQISYVDGYRRGASLSKAATSDSIRFSPEYACWQENRMDARQATIYRASLTYGQSFVLVNTTHKSNRTKVDILPTRQTVAYFDDPVNDIRPRWVLSIVSSARDENTPGLAVFWDETNRYELHLNDKHEFRAHGNPVPHGLTGCPVVRYTCGPADDEGRAVGVLNTTIYSLQDRLNQACFSTNVTADSGAFKVRTASGLEVQYKHDPITGEELVGPDGNPIPVPITISQAKLLISESPDTKFSQLDETPISGYLLNEDQATKNLAAIAQFPLHALMGSVSNLSAEALAALETQFFRLVQSYQTSWGESHEELFRLMAEALGDAAGTNSYGGEVRWRDMESKSFAAVMDGLGKAAEMLDVPRRGLWSFIPGLTSGDIQDLEVLREEQGTEEVMDAMKPTAASARERRVARPEAEAVADTP